MIYRHRFQVRASLEKVAEFHYQAASMAAITLPPIRVQMQRAPERLAEGDEMQFTLWLGPLPVGWLARIENVSPDGFSDRQLRGPFEEWIHRHKFEAVNENLTAVIDEIHIRLSRHPIRWLTGLGMWIGLPLLFAYRGFRTERILR